MSDSCSSESLSKLQGLHPQSYFCDDCHRATPSGFLLQGCTGLVSNNKTNNKTEAGQGKASCPGAALESRICQEVTKLISMYGEILDGAGHPYWWIIPSPSRLGLWRMSVLLSAHTASNAYSYGNDRHCCLILSQCYMHFSVCSTLSRPGVDSTLSEAQSTCHM